MSVKGKQPTVIRFVSQLHQIKTLVDGGVNVTLALPGTAVQAVTELLKCKQPGVMLEVAIVPVKVNPLPNAKVKDAKEKTARRRQRYPYREAGTADGQ